MKFTIELFVRAHRNGFFTLRVAGNPPLSVYTASLEDARQDLILVLGDHIERAHPSLQSTLITIGAERLEELELEKELPVFGESGEAKAPLRFSALISERRSFLGLWFPRAELYHWLPRKDPAWKTAAEEVLRSRLGRMTPAELLELRYEKKEWIEQLEVDARPPPLSMFTGKNRNLTMLPPKGEAELEKEAEEELDPDELMPASKGKKKKKRPETPTLRKIGTNLGQAALEKELEHAHERTRELDDLLRVMESPGEKAVAVIGPTGVGKSAILNELVYRLKKKSVPDKLRLRPIWFADASRLIAGEGYFGDWQRQCLDVIAECEAAEVIWFIGPLLPLLDAGKSIHSDQNVALLLKPYLASKRLTIVGECTSKDFAKLELRDAALARAFTPYRIEEPPLPESRRILEKVAAELGEDEEIEIKKEGLDAIFELTKRYVTDGSHLGAAIHFLRRTVEAMSARDAKLLGRHEAVASFSMETGLPERLIRDDLPLDPEAVRAAFRARLIGQDEAVSKMTELIAVIKAGLSDLSRPLGSFLFVGPTGVGKTETAKALAHYLFGGEHRLARFDMSEYVGYDAVHRFLGDARSEGKLVEVIRKRPFSVVLLDEVEKAHPAIFDVLLQVLGEARLTDEAGRIADFRNAVVIMTSNLGVDTFKARVGFELSAELRAHFVRETERFFRPELFNRIDHIVPFGPLGEPAIREITGRELTKLAAREGLRQRDLSLTYHPELYTWLAERGVDPRYGARPLKRVIERELAIPLARQISRSQTDDAPILEARPSGETVGFLPAPLPAGVLGLSARAGVAEALRELIAKIDDLVFRVQRWKTSEGWRELVQELRLLDQLAQNKLFWKDRELAEARMFGVEDKRAIVNDWNAFESRAAALQDLAYEAHHVRAVEQTALVADELGKLTAAIEDLELRLFERRFTEPSRAVLYLDIGRGAAPFARSLVELYANLAYDAGWRFSVHVATRPDAVVVEEPPPDPAKPPRAKRPPAIKLVDKQGNDATRSRVVWNREASFDADPKLAGEGEPEARRARAFRELPRPPDQGELALVFEGPRAAALMWAETGVHQLVSGADNHQVKVAFADVDKNTSLAHPADVAFSNARVRLIHENKKQVEDSVLDLHFALEPRVFRIYRRLIRARMIAVVFPGRGKDWFKAWEGRS